MPAEGAVIHSKVDCEAASILAEALALGIRVGTNGAELLMIAPLKVPREVHVQFEIALNKFRAEVIEIIQRENAARQGMRS
jgi:hypothetical protein